MSLRHAGPERKSDKRKGGDSRGRKEGDDADEAGGDDVDDDGVGEGEVSNEDKVQLNSQ